MSNTIHNLKTPIYYFYLYKHTYNENYKEIELYVRTRDYEISISTDTTSLTTSTQKLIQILYSVWHLFNRHHERHFESNCKQFYALLSPIKDYFRIQKIINLNKQ